MENRIYVRDLDCYRLASEEERSGRLVSPDRFFEQGKDAVLKKHPCGVLALSCDLPFPQ